MFFNLSIDKHKNKKNLKILACGGDGTVSSVLSALSEVLQNNSISVAIMPLGRIINNRSCYIMINYLK